MAAKIARDSLKLSVDHIPAEDRDWFLARLPEIPQK
jgi:hypothetical protein